MSSTPEEFEGSSAPEESVKDSQDVALIDQGSILAELHRIFSPPRPPENLEAASDQAAQLFESAEKGGHFGAAVSAVAAYCKSPEGLHHVVVFERLCSAALTPSSHERKALNLQQIGFEPKAPGGVGQAQQNRLAAACILGGGVGSAWLESARDRFKNHRPLVGVGGRTR